MARQKPKLRGAIRDLIKAEELINMLQDNALDPNAKPIHQSKLHAIQTLLMKCLPNLKTLEITGEEGGPIQKNLKISFVPSGKDSFYDSEMIPTIEAQPSDHLPQPSDRLESSKSSKSLETVIDSSHMVLDDEDTTKS